MNRKSAPRKSSDDAQQWNSNTLLTMNGYDLSKEKIEGVDVVSFIIERVLCATF